MTRWPDVRGLTSGTGVRGLLKHGGKLVASALTVASAGIVPAPAANWFALTALSVVFVVVIAAALLVMRRSARIASSG